MDALLGAITDADPIVRTEAAYCLGDAMEERALPALLLAVDDPHFGVRQAAIDALGMIGDSRATGRLLRAVDDERPDVRFQALIALGRVSSDDGLEAALRGLHDDDSRVRYIAVRTVEEIVTKNLESRGTPVRLDVLPDSVVKQVAQCLDDEDPHVGLAAAILLGRTGDDRGANRLLEAIEDRIGSLEPEDEVAAIELAGSLGLEQAIPALEGRAYGLLRWVKERHSWTARVALVRLGSERARHTIVADLRSWSRDQRTAAVMAAGQAGIVEAIGVIEAMAGDHEKAAQDAVTEALEILRGETVDRSRGDEEPQLPASTID